MIHNTFKKGPEGWCSYDYHHAIVSKREIFVLATWDTEGGANNSGYAFADHTTWSTDTPERPVSILALMFMRAWINEGPIDMRGARVSVYCRGDGLRLWGGKCYFWAHMPFSRWYLTSRPLVLGDGAWTAEPNRLVLANDESLWHQSWAGDPPKPVSLDRTLSNAISYGFGFTGFTREPDGKFCISDFKIELA